MSNIPQALSRVGAVKSLKLLSQNSTTTTAASLKGGYLGSVISIIYTVKTFMLELVLFRPSNNSRFLVSDQICRLRHYISSNILSSLHCNVHCEIMPKVSIFDCLVKCFTPGFVDIKGISNISSPLIFLCWRFFCLTQSVASWGFETIFGLQKITLALLVTNSKSETLFERNSQSFF